MHRPAVAWFGVLLSVGFAYLAVRNVRFGDVWRGLSSSNYWWVLPALVMLAVTVALKAVRWRYLFAAPTRPEMRPVVAATLVGYFFNAVLPARAGEAARVLALRRRAGTSRAEAAATVLLERMYDVLSLLVVLFVCVPWLPHVSWLHAAVVLALVLAAGVVIAVAVLTIYGERSVRFVLHPLGRLPFVSEARLTAVAANLTRGLSALLRPRLVAAASVSTTLAWLTLGVSMWLLMRGFHLHLSLVAALLVVVATNLVQILPSSPAAVGAFEAATLVALRAYGVPDAKALSYALVLHLVNLVPFLLAGPLVLHGTLRVRD
jgi:uncharacterized protein (TIRG00374 family)